MYNSSRSLILQPSAGGEMNITLLTACTGLRSRVIGAVVYLHAAPWAQCSQAQTSSIESRVTRCYCVDM